MQLEAWLHKALIRLTYTVESRLCNTETIGLCNSPRLVDPLTQRVIRFLVSGKSVGKLNEPTLFSSTIYPALTTPFHFLSLNYFTLP